MLSLCVLTLLLAGAGAQSIENEPDWGFQSYLDVDYTLKCNHSQLVVQPYNFVKWELPDGQLLTAGTEKYTLGNRDNVINMHLTVKNVQESDAGVYVCHVYSGSSMRNKLGQLLRGLNVGGHKYREPFEEYRYNLMVGGLAALALFLPFLTICFVYKFRYQTDEQKRSKREARLEANRHQRHLDANGKGAELTTVSEKDGQQGETNPSYDNGSEQTNTRL